MSIAEARGLILFQLADFIRLIQHADRAQLEHVSAIFADAIEVIRAEPCYVCLGPVLQSQAHEIIGHNLVHASCHSRLDVDLRLGQGEDE